MNKIIWRSAISQLIHRLESIIGQRKGPIVIGLQISGIV